MPPFPCAVCTDDHPPVRVTAKGLLRPSHHAAQLARFGPSAASCAGHVLALGFVSPSVIGHEVALGKGPAGKAVDACTVLMPPWGGGR